MKMKEFKVTVRQFLTKPSTNPAYKDKKPVPMRTMFGYIKQETAQGVYVVLHGKPAPSSVCLHCGREITHPVSLYACFGSTCLPTYYPHIYAMVHSLNPDQIEEAYKILKEQLADITWEGWLPRAYVGLEETGEEIEIEEKKAEEAPKLSPKPTPEQREVKREPVRITPQIVEPTVDQTLVNDLLAELGF